MNRFFILFPIALITLTLGGCMHAISKEAREEVSDDVAFADVYNDPHNYIGTRLLTGGLILGITEEGPTTTLEILAFDLAYNGEPIDIDESGERFLARTAQEIDERFDNGLLVTLTGTVAGSETVALTGRDYTYPLLLLHEIHLWDEPFRRGQVPGQDPATPFHEPPPQREGHENPYDPSYNPFPYTPYYYR